MHEEVTRAGVAGTVLLAATLLAAQARADPAVAAPRLFEIDTRVDAPALALPEAVPTVLAPVPTERATPPTLATQATPATQAVAAGKVADTRLAELRGGTDTAGSAPWNAPWSDMRLNGSVDNNVASNVVTGANVVTDGAFSNASGLPMVIQNSGANVLIQNATIVNVQFR